MVECLTTCQPLSSVHGRMEFTREQSFNALASLQPAAVFLEAYQGHSLPHNLASFFGPPEELFIAPDSQAPYTKGHLIPLLDDGCFCTVTLFNPSTGRLIQRSMELPEEGIVTLQNWQQYLATVMLRMAESLEEEEDAIRAIAAILDFHHVDALLAHLEHAQALTGDAWWQARAAFPVSLPA